MRNTSLLFFTILVGISTVYAQSSSGSSSGSGSGSGSGDGFTCTSLSCSHGCNETDDGPMCWCPIGYELGENDMTCQVCRGGYWGMDCNRTCNCGPGGSGNPCNNVNGACICNSCWNGSNCEIATSSQCLLEFFQEANKNEEILRQRYGGVSFPIPPDDTLRGLIVDDLLEAMSPAIVANPELTVVNRRDVGQGDLAKLKFTVDYTASGRSTAESALERLQEKVKLGDLRVTLIQQIFTDRAEVTINAGTQV